MSFSQETGAIFDIAQGAYGKAVQHQGGPVHPDSDYGFIATSSEFPPDATHFWRELQSNGPIQANEIDKGAAASGALFFKSFPDGLVAARVRFRPEGGTDAQTRSVVVGRFLFLPGIRVWADLPFGLLHAVAKNLLNPTVVYAPEMELPPLHVALPPSPDSDDPWFAVIEENADRADRYVDFLDATVGSLDSVFPIGEFSGPELDEITTDLDYVSVAHRVFEKTRSQSYPIDVAIGFKRRLGSGSISISESFSTQRNTQRNPGVIAELRESLIAPIESEAPTPERRRTRSPIRDSTGRKIGVEAITLELP